MRELYILKNKIRWY